MNYKLCTYVRKGFLKQLDILLAADLLLIVLVFCHLKVILLLLVIET